MSGQMRLLHQDLESQQLKKTTFGASELTRTTRAVSLTVTRRKWYMDLEAFLKLRHNLKRLLTAKRSRNMTKPVPNHNSVWVHRSIRLSALTSKFPPRLLNSFRAANALKMQTTCWFNLNQLMDQKKEQESRGTRLSKDKTRSLLISKAHALTNLTMTRNLRWVKMSIS